MKFGEWIGYVPSELQPGFRSAYAAALCSPGVGQGNFRHGAAILDKTVPVSVGYNSYKTHPKLADVTPYPYLHAECHSMFKYGIDNIEGLDIYVIRVTNTGAIAMSKPCSVCSFFIEEARIRNVYYSTGKGVYHYEN